MSRLVRLYPRAWRDRYEIEFLGLIGDRPPSLVERFDIIRGAVDAHLHPQVRRRADATPPPPVPDADLRVARRLGFAAVLGAVLWPSAFVVASMGPVRYDGDGAYRDGAAALPILLLAVILLAAGLLGHLIRLPRDARLARGSALTAIPFLLLWGTAPWLWPRGLIAVGLVVALAVAGLRSGAWPLWGSLTVVAAGVGVIAIGAAGAAVAGTDRMAAGYFFFLIGLVLVPAWLGVGATLVRRRTLSGASAR
jgi:hypothetical protein